MKRCKFDLSNATRYFHFITLQVCSNTKTYLSIIQTIKCHCSTSSHGLYNMLGIDATLLSIFRKQTPALINFKFNMDTHKQASKQANKQTKHE